MLKYLRNAKTKIAPRTQKKGFWQVLISIDGKGAWRDNVFVERLWRSVKYEEVYLKACENVPQDGAEIGKYLTFYNTKRPHSSLDGQTPDQAYFNALTPIPVAA